VIAFKCQSPKIQLISTQTQATEEHFSRQYKQSKTINTFFPSICETAVLLWAYSRFYIDKYFGHSPVTLLSQITPHWLLLEN
jgi:hypothetical protein